MARFTINQLTPEQRTRFEAIRARFPEIVKQFESEKPRILRLAQLEKAMDESRARMRRALLERLREVREANGLSLKQVAERGGFAIAALCRLETDGQANPTIETLQRYAEAVDTELVIDLVPKVDAPRPKVTRTGARHS